MKKIGLVMVLVFSLTAIGGLVLSHAELKYLEKQGMMKTMIEWNKALGVKCNFCHIQDKSQTYKSLAGKTVSEEELKALVHRRIARAMLGTMLYLNKTEGKNYTCNTCHQGEKEVELK
jgi:cytochrome c peroxidase